MPVYKVLVSDASGRTKTIKKEASSEGLLLRTLAAEGYMALQVKQEKQKERTADMGIKPLSLEKNQQFCASLASFLKSGLPLVQVLGLMERTSARSRKDQRGAQLFGYLKASVESGRSLAAAMKESGAFRPVLLGLVESAERSSKLPETMERAARLFDDELKLRRKIQSAVTYPAAMLAVGIGVVIFLMTYVVPKLTALFADMGADLPTPTKILLFLSSTISNLWLPTLCVIILVLYYMKRTKKEINIPFFKGTRQELTLSLVFSHLGTLLKSGIPLVQALELTAPMDKNRQRWTNVADFVRKGYRFSQALEKESDVQKEIFPEDVLAVLRIAEAGSDMPDALERLGQSCWDRAQSNLQRIADLAEPAIIVVLGAMVAFVVISVLLPIFDLSSLVQ